MRQFQVVLNPGVVTIQESNIFPLGFPNGPIPGCTHSMVFLVKHS